MTRKTRKTTIQDGAKKLDTATVQLAELSYDDANPRTHTPRNLRAIASSLKKFGQVEHLVVQRTTKVVYGGNGRLRAMRALGWSECSVVWIDQEGKSARELAVALNRSGELAGWDDGLLASVLSGQQGEDLLAQGWEERELTKLLATDDDLPTFEDDDESHLGGGLAYRIVIDCLDEAHQTDLLQRFDEEGLQCQPLIS